MFTDDDYEEFWAQQAVEQHRENYLAWRNERLADDPDTPEEEVSEDAYTDYLVGQAEAADEESSWARGCGRGSWSR